MTTSHTGTAEADTCVPNIVARGRRSRLLFGIVALAAGVVAALWLAGSDIDRVWRLFTLLPFWAGASGIFQAYAHT